MVAPGSGFSQRVVGEGICGHREPFSSLPPNPLRGVCSLPLPSVEQQFRILVFDLGQELAKKWPYNWSTGLSIGALCTIIRAWPVWRGPGANFWPKTGPKQPNTKTKMIVVIIVFFCLSSVCCVLSSVFVVLSSGLFVFSSGVFCFLECVVCFIEWFLVLSSGFLFHRCPSYCPYQV